MGKRSNFTRSPRDYYPTPYKAVIPLLPFIDRVRYIEPCAGDGRLVEHLKNHGHKCMLSCDIEPQSDTVSVGNALDYKYSQEDLIITNPPWNREFLHEFINKIINDGASCWLLFDSDWMFTKQAKELLKYCDKIVSVGRVSWMENGKSGMDNCAWYNFIPMRTTTKFYNW